jgi:site-specific recombinase XerC
VSRFAGWCEANGLTELVDLEPVHVSAYVEQLGKQLSPPSVKQHLAAIRMLCDWLVVGQVIATNPAAPVRGARHVVRKGKTPVLAAEEARTLLDSIPGDTVVGMRDRALIALMVYTFARVGAVIRMRSEDVYVQGRRTWVRLHEKGGKRHEMPCHHSLDTYLAEYIEAVGVAGELKGWLFLGAYGSGEVPT